MRLSRWGRSPYETDLDMSAERALLAPLVRVTEPHSDAEIVVVTSKQPVGPGRLPSSARLVLTTTSGTDHLDLPWLRARSITAARLPLARRDAVAESTLELAIWGLRASGTLRAEARAGRWARGRLPGLGMRTVRGAKVGVVGLGVIGKRVAHIFDALGAEVRGVDPLGGGPSRAMGALVDVARWADVLTLHCDLNPTSRRMISAPLLAQMRPGAVLINTARGELVDAAAALAAVDAGRLGALGLDVFPVEPWPAIASGAARPQVSFTPHSAGFHDGLARAVREGLHAAVLAWTSGRALPHRVA